MQFFVIKKRSILLFLFVCIAAAAGLSWFFLQSSSQETFNQANDQIREIHMVTGEFKSTMQSGKEIEAYRWDPGTIFMEKGERIRLKIYGVNGNEHPFIIEGTDFKGGVKKGEETTIPLKFEKEGTYRLICLTHPDKEHDGPMIAYIVVD